MVLAALVAGATMFAASATFAADDADAALDMFLELKPVKGESADDG